MFSPQTITCQFDGYESEDSISVEKDTGSEFTMQPPLHLSSPAKTLQCSQLKELLLDPSGASPSHASLTSPALLLPRDLAQGICSNAQAKLWFILMEGKGSGAEAASPVAGACSLDQEHHACGSLRLSPVSPSATGRSFLLNAM